MIPILLFWQKKYLFKSDISSHASSRETKEGSIRAIHRDIEKKTHKKNNESNERRVNMKMRIDLD
jgi:hypothetical protein